ncbi:MAG: DUF5011 domain-containing protein [Bacilli bacterium]|nr:DUF5011 domain-containing protein [Bacilli bacterium]
MYFNSNDKGTNIDSEFSSKKMFSFNKKTLSIIGISFGVILLIIFLIFILGKNSADYQKFLVLEGNTDIIIYQNSLYEDPGYKAYDSKGNDLGDEVSISGEVNTSLVGDYVVTYKLDDIIKERRISVISRPNQLTYLILSGEPIIHLRVGSTYTEPGYTVIDSVSTDLKDKVVIDGNVDTSKAGTYIIKYSVTNDSGVTVSEKRTIIVTDSSLSLVANPSEYTKDKVTINVSVMDNYFDYVLLPNGNKNSNRSFTYEVNENGTYKFKLFSKDGNSTDSEITVKNIDRTAPKISSCNITVGESKSTIKISASDNGNIKSYAFYNNGNVVTTSSNSSFSINNIELNGQYILVIDKAGNSSKRDCTIKETIVKLNADVNKMAGYLNSVSKAQIVTFSRGKIVNSYSTGCNKNDALYISAGSKTIVGLTAAKMAQDGIVNLDENIATYWRKLYKADFSTYSANWRKHIGSSASLSDYVSPEEDLNQNSAALRHFLTHSSTVHNLSMIWMIPGDETTEYFGGGLSKTYSRAAFMLGHTWGQLFEWKATPGVKTNYSYLKDELTREHATAGLTLQISMKETIDEYLNKNIWNKIGASSNPSFDDGNSIYFATSYKTSAEDLAKLIAAVANDGVYNGTRIFAKSSVNELEKVEAHLANQTIAFSYMNGKYVRYGVYSYISRGYMYDIDDMIDEYASFISYDPKTSNGFVVIASFKNKNAKKESYKMFDSMSNYFYSR